MHYVYNKLDKILFTKFYPGKILLRLTDYVRNWGHKDCPKNKKKKRKSASLLPKLTITDAVWFLKLWEKYLLNFWGKKITEYDAKEEEKGKSKIC